MRFSVAFLLIWGCGFASCEKRQAGRGRPGWRYQEGRGRGFLFLALKMSQNSIDDVLVFDATARRSDDNSDRTTAAATNLDVDTEHTFKALGPGNGGMALGGCADFCVSDRLDAFPAPGWRNQPTTAAVRRQDTVVTGEIDPRLWYQSR
ncbi:hypothetical protein [Candidatus Seongchinamella marina]|uniref:hypothetical protein n=1 Tax=Candidatus Seongchinamella marina TaxID=2518990 RepID=UPI002431D35C|nr:hypothetical protein [Candidatus Seongchinamella marina]